METLTPARRRALRAKAHHLHPVVSIGQHGLTPAVLHEIDVNLTAHELIKIRVFEDARDEREAMLARICDALSATPVQHLGKLLIVWRPAPKDEPAPKAAPAARSAARKAPQVRRPRSPLPRAPARPPRGRFQPDAPAAPGSRRRKTAAEGPKARAVEDGVRARRRPRAGPATAPAPAPRAPRGGPSQAGTKRRGVPHGKSASSRTGAAGARRRRKAR